MDIELLIISDCPNSAPAGELLARALQLEGVDPTGVVTKEVRTEVEAQALGFHGSPSFTVNGADLFPTDADPAVTCRVYPTPEGLRGLPTLASLREVIRGSLTPGTRQADTSA